MKLQSTVQVLTIYIGADDKWRRGLLYPAIVEHLQQAGIAGVTVVQADEGFGAHGKLHGTHGATFFLDRPVLIQAVDVPERIAIALPILDEMIEHGLVTIADVSAIRYMADPKN